MFVIPENQDLLKLYPQYAPDVSKRPFSPPSFPARRKRRGRRRHVGNGLDGTSPRAKRGASYPLSPFPPFQNINASLVYVLGPGLDGTSPRAKRGVSYPLSPFPPSKAQTLRWFAFWGLGLDGTSPCGGKRISCTSRLFKVLSRKST